MRTPSADAQELGRAVKAYRRKEGLTQTELARRLRLPHSSGISDLEAGRNLHPRTMKAVRDLLANGHTRKPRRSR